MSIYTVLLRSDKSTTLVGTCSTFFKAERKVLYMFETQGLTLRNKFYSKNSIGYDSGDVVYEIYETILDD